MPWRVETPMSQRQDFVEAWARHWHRRRVVHLTSTCGSQAPERFGLAAETQSVRTAWGFLEGFLCLSFGAIIVGFHNTRSAGAAAGLAAERRAYGSSEDVQCSERIS